MTTEMAARVISELHSGLYSDDPQSIQSIQTQIHKDTWGRTGSGAGFFFLGRISQRLTIAGWPREGR